MNRKVVSSAASLGLAAAGMAMAYVQVNAQENVPVSVSLTVPEDAVNPPNVVALPDTGFGFGLDATNIFLVILVVVGFALTYVGMLNLRRIGS